MCKIKRSCFENREIIYKIDISYFSKSSPKNANMWWGFMFPMFMKGVISNKLFMYLHSM